jgi:hypothetical protein
VELYYLEGFDLSRVHTLSLSLVDGHRADPNQLSLHLPSCQQLRALSLTHWTSLLQEAVVLQTITALPQLQHLRLHLHHYDKTSSQLDCSAMAVLTGCRQLKQLTLVGMVGLQEGTVVALMMLPRLRLLRLLGCSPGLSQKRCQALVGQLRLYELQVDVVVDDGSARTRWMMRKLGGGGHYSSWSNCWLMHKYVLIVDPVHQVASGVAGRYIKRVRPVRRASVQSCFYAFILNHSF